MINWEYVSQAIDFYQSKSYKYIEVPWVVSKLAIDATFPKNTNRFTCDIGTMVGSAEQSFVQLMLDKNISLGKYVAASPCFRDDIIDELHSLSFFKVELIHIFKSSDGYPDYFISNSLEEMTLDAIEFFRTLPLNNKINVKMTNEGFDIELNNIEIGSYGIRTLDNLCWVYGTGFADPRFSIANNNHNK